VGLEEVVVAAAGAVDREGEAVDLVAAVEGLAVVSAVDLVVADLAEGSVAVQEEVEDSAVVSAADQEGVDLVLVEGVLAGSIAAKGGGNASPNRGQLNSFPGMPSDEGMPHSGALLVLQLPIATSRSTPVLRGLAAGAAASNRNQPNYPELREPRLERPPPIAISPNHSAAQGAAAGRRRRTENQPQYSGAVRGGAGYAAGQNNFGTGFGQVTPSAPL